MQDVLSIIEKVAPDIMDTLRERYQILRNIYLLGPVGRRVLASKMDVTERVLRTETDFLKKRNIITEIRNVFTEKRNIRTSKGYITTAQRNTGTSIKER